MRIYTAVVKCVCLSFYTRAHSCKGLSGVTGRQKESMGWEALPISTHNRRNPRFLGCSLALLITVEESKTLAAEARAHQHWAEDASIPPRDALHQHARQPPLGFCHASHESIWLMGCYDMLACLIRAKKHIRVWIARKQPKRFMYKPHQEYDELTQQLPCVLRLQILFGPCCFCYRGRGSLHVCHVQVHKCVCLCVWLCVYACVCVFACVGACVYTYM